MRILAIRGCNLASLAGEFEIDLVGGPLGGAGVFAIVGPTGAGKSTLLDAMCVALFDRTPRLTNRSTVVIGRGDDDPTALGAQDVRTLLRRGASAGWAEVDFESGDTRRYRARWSVRRARGATDGRFQNQQLTLTAIDGGQQLGGTKTETLEAIHERLGLTFDQFRRSALLAQGEFATFLRAEGKDRSELLERMTGTEIYSQLSIAAHLKAALAQQQLRDRHGAAMAIAVLADDARAAAEAELQLARQARAVARERLAVAEQAARWLAEDERRRGALAAAEAEHAAGVAALEAATPAREELALRRRAEALRSVWEEATRLDRQHAISCGDAQVAVEGEARARAAHEAIMATRGRLAALHAPVREARIAAGIVERVRGGHTAGIEARATAAAADAAWMVTRRGLAPEISGWRDLEASFAQHAALTDEIRAVDRALADDDRRRTALEQQRAVAAAEHQGAVTRLEEARREAASFQQRRGLTLDAAARQEKEARRHVADVERLVVIAGEASAAATAKGELEHRLAELATAGTADGEARRAAAGESERATVLRDERARVLAELRRAAGYQHARAELVEGDPCPLCGATEHPWQHRGAFDALIGEAEARLAECVAQLDAAVRAVAALVARDDQRAVERERLAAALAATETNATGATSAWREQLAALGELVLVADPATGAARQLAEDRVQAARARLEAAGAARSQAEAVAKASQEAHARVQARQTEVEHHARRLVELDRECAAVRAATERARGERTGKLDRLRELIVAIEVVLARWSAALPADEARPLASATGRTGARLEPELTHGFEAARTAAAELARAWQRHADVITELDAALAAELSEIDRRSLAAERAVAEQAARRVDSEQRRDAFAGELAAAVTRLDGARVAAGFAADELRALLAAEPGRVEALVEQLAALERALERARTRLGERRRLVDDHAVSRPASAEAADLAELAAMVTVADDHAAALTATLAADGEARARRAAALASFAAAEQAAEVDRVLGEVIGSHDGKLFRSFAQSLTLDGLLAVANSHLEELAPRYQLERVPRHDLELQVIDRDLGGEVRSVQSLSGGESFLVSLALALGLSSMSAHDVRVRTLLIDEGFGTLDPATLDSALAVLDALQATGRQVGVISHVPALLERVGAHVRVAPRGGGRSEVLVAEA